MRSSIINSALSRLSRRSLGKASDFLVFAINPFTQFTQYIDSRKTLQYIALASALIAFSVACMSCHNVNQFLE